MVLQELEIQGFKSFPDRTKIKIGPGITAVVGPNGSGKSNISDAIRWVLGETSSKQLRGAGKMEDVIFGGTQTRGAMGYAMVNLTMDNLDRRIDVDADQVTIGRRYYRSGESEYTINGQNVRLKDIYELFLDTGVGRDGYSIISQGRIAEIVGAKSNERREIFEEASGIARYRYRKNEAERRLAGAEDNLVRLRDILAELESRVGPLEKESQKAQQFLELSARRKEREITLWVDNIRRSRETVREQQRRFETAQADYDRLTAELESIDAETEEIRRRVQQYTVEIERRNADIRAITEEMAGSDSRIAVLNNDIAHNENTIASLRGEIEQGQAGKEAIAAQIAKGVERATAEIPLRPNTVDPLTRENHGSNLGPGMPIIHYIPEDGDFTEITVLPKGAGSENMTRLGMLNPSDGVQGVEDFIVDAVLDAGGRPCPPTVIGVGIGGMSDTCAEMAKMALACPLDVENPDKTLRDMEERIFVRLNKSGLGPMGLGGATTCLGVRIKKAACHTASLPVAVSIGCWATRRASARITDHGVEYAQGAVL